MHSSPPPLIPALTTCFLQLGFQGSGGLGAVLALLSRELVQQRGWLTEADITEALTYTKLLPGSTVVQVVAYLGWKLRGWLGGIVATIAFLLPAFLLMLSLAASYGLLALNAGVTAALTGLTAAVVGLLVLTTWTLGRKNITHIRGLVIALAALIASVRFGINPAAIVVVSGLWGVLVETRQEPS